VNSPSLQRIADERRRPTASAVLVSLALAGAAHLAASAGPGRPAIALAQTSASPEAPYDVFEKSIAELQQALSAGTVSSRDLVERYLARIRAYDSDGPRLNAMIALNLRVRENADRLDAERRAGRVRGPLHGVPVVIKDNFATADMPTTGGSLALERFNTGGDAYQVRQLRDAGALIIGKTNLHELAYGITTVSSMGGQTRNPYDPSRNPGGSSGGTGAAVAASFAAAGMGSDTCGSIRNPSARHTGTVEPGGNHPVVAHPGHRRSARSERCRSRGDARRNRRSRPSRSHHRQGSRPYPVILQTRAGCITHEGGTHRGGGVALWYRAGGR
jgi:hypothetical protein